MDLIIHTVQAGILRAAFAILGFLWGVMIVQRRDNAAGDKAFGLAIMAIFLAMGIWMAF